MIYLQALLIKMVMHFIGRTCRIEKIIGQEVIDEIMATKEPVILTFWHNRIFYSTYIFNRFLFSKGLPISVLISQSKDGNIMSQIIKLFGGKVARGSSSKGGKEALANLIKLMKKEKYTVVTTPDGPRGPKYKFQEGTLVLAQLTGAKLIPFTFAAKNKIVFNSWDNFIIPKLFSKTTIAFSKPIVVPRKMSKEEKEKMLLDIEASMLKQTLELDLIYE